MKRRNVLIAVMLAGFLVMISVTTVAQEKKIKLSDATETKKVKQSEATETKKIDLGKAALVSPAILLGNAEELELTESQHAQLLAIMKEMQIKTMAVLTKAQAAKVETWKPAPQMAQKIKMALPMESTEPADTKTKIVKEPDSTKSQVKQIAK